MVTDTMVKTAVTMATNGKIEKEVVVTGSIGWSPIESITVTTS